MTIKKTVYFYPMRSKLILLIGAFFLLGCGDKTLNKKKVFRYNSEQGLTSLDPAFASNLPNIRTTSQMFNGLLELDSNLNVKPSLATSWTISDDLLTYTFNVREGVFFHDHKFFENGKGRELKAYDFEYSFKRICDTSSLYNQGIWIFKDIVLKNNLGQISDTCFRAISDYEFRIYLDKPAPHLLQILTMNYTFVVPHEVTEKLGLDFRTSPVGTGPFKFGEWVEGEALIMYKNDNYWKKDQQGNSIPYLDAIEVSFIPDKSQAFRSFMLGELDYITSVEESFIDDVLYRDGEVKESFLEKYNVQKEAYFNTEYLGFQLDESAEVYVGQEKKSPLLNVDFRKALSYSVDRKKLVSYLRNSLGYPGEHGFIPPPTPNFNLFKVEGYNFNPKLAKEYLRKSNIDVETIAPISLTVVKEYEPLIEFLAKTWEDVLGVRVELDIKDAKVGRVMVNSGKTAFFKQSWLGDYPEAGNYMSLLYSGNFTPYGPNKMHFKNEKCDSLFQIAQTTINEQERVDLYTQMDNLAMKDVPMIILFYDEMLQLSQKNINGLKANAMSLLWLERVRLID